MTLQLTNPAVDVTVAGITIVFGMLILLVAIISVFGAIMSGTTKKPKVKCVPKQVVKETVVDQKVAQPVVQNDDEIIAVITAAVYSMYEGTGVKPVIKAIRPSVGRSAWSMAGIRNNMKSFF